MRKELAVRRDQSGMNNGSDYDFIIIGSGAGGGTLAYSWLRAASEFS